MNIWSLNSEEQQRRGLPAPPHGPSVGDWKAGRPLRPSTGWSRSPCWPPDLPAAVWGCFCLKSGLEWFSLPSNVTSACRSGWNWIMRLPWRRLGVGVSACVCVCSRTVILLFYYGSMLFWGLHLPPHKGFFSTRKMKTGDIWTDVIRMKLTAAAAPAFYDGTEGWWENGDAHQPSRDTVSRAGGRGFLPDPVLLGLLQLGVPPQHRHDGPLLLLRQVAQVNHGSSHSSCCFPQQEGAEAQRGRKRRPAKLLAGGQQQKQKLFF